MKIRSFIPSTIIVMIMVLSTIQLTAPVTALETGRIYITESGVHDLSAYDNIGSIVVDANGPVTITNVNAEIPYSKYIDLRSSDVSITNSFFNITGGSGSSSFYLYPDINTRIVNTTFSFDVIKNMRIGEGLTDTSETVDMQNITIDRGTLLFTDLARSSLNNSHVNRLHTTSVMGPSTMINNTFKDVRINAIDHLVFVNNSIARDTTMTYAQPMVDLYGTNNAIVSNNTITSNSVLAGFRLGNSENVTMAHNYIQLGSHVLPDRSLEDDYGIRMRYYDNITLINNTVISYRLSVDIGVGGDIGIHNSTIKSYNTTALEVTSIEDTSNLTLVNNFLQSAQMVAELHVTTGYVFNNTMTNGGYFHYVMRFSTTQEIVVTNNTFINGHTDPFDSFYTTDGIYIIENNTVTLIDNQFNPIGFRSVSTFFESKVNTVGLIIHEVNPDTINVTFEGEILLTGDISSNLVGNELKFDLPMLLEGSYSIRVWANDTNGNEFNSSYNFQVGKDTYPPNLSIYVYGPYYFPGLTPIVIRAFDDLNYTLDVYVNGSEVVRDHPGQYLLDLEYYELGFYNISVIAVDLAGNSVKETANFTILKETNIPYIEFDDGDQFKYDQMNSTVEFQFTIHDMNKDLGIVEISNQGQVLYTTDYTIVSNDRLVISGTFDIPSGIGGTQEFTITVTDYSGNTNSTTVELVLPEIEVSSTTQEQSTSGTIWFSGSVIQSISVLIAIPVIIRKSRNN